MTKAEIAETLRQEVGHLEVSIKKLQDRCNRLKRFVLDLEEEIAVPRKPTVLEEGKFRQMIDKVFGEEPKTKKR